MEGSVSQGVLGRPIAVTREQQASCDRRGHSLPPRCQRPRHTWRWGPMRTSPCSLILRPGSPPGSGLDSRTGVTPGEAPGAGAACS